MTAIIISIIAGVLAIFIIAIIAISNKVFNVAVKSKVSKKQVMTTNAETLSTADKSVEFLCREWLCAQQFEEQYISANDGTKIFSRILRASATSSKWAILCHGFTGDGLKMGGASKHFYDNGYNLLLPDLRGCGNSGGKYYSMGWLDSEDMLLWISLITTQDKNAKIVLTGGSMGGATVMMTTGLDLPKNVVAAVEDCGYTSVWDEFTYQLKKTFGLPQFPFMYIANIMCKLRAGYSFKDASSIKRLANSKTPTLFIHGSNDNFVPAHMLKQNYDAASCEKQMLEVPIAGHGNSADTNPELYWGTVDVFLERYI